MKMKLKATARDWLIFGVFAIVLLYFVALGVLNLRALSETGNFSGLNPLPAFGKDLAGTTIMFYIIALVGLFVAVSSYFFDTEEGFGIATGDKADKGYSRWCKDKEMKKELKQVDVARQSYDDGGFPIINDGKYIWVDDGEYHNLVIGSTGSGKTQGVVHPMVKILARRGESMVITDPKAEIYRESCGLLKEKGYKIIVLNFREPQKGNQWNPFDMPYKLYKNGNTDKAMELLDDLALNLLYEEGASDPFWSSAAADYFSGLSIGLFEDAEPDQININSISYMASVGEEKFGARSNYLKEYFNDKDQTGSAYISASGTVYAPDETRGGITSTFKQKLRLFASRENISEMLSKSDFDMENIGKEKTAVFMIIQDEKKTYHALATIFVKQCYEALIDVAQSTSKGELPVKTNFILDEFANMPPLKDVTTMITAARSRLIRFTLMIQNFAQLDQVYGKENAQTIRSNCGNLMYLLTTELAALEEISKLCGEVKSKKDDKTVSTPLVTVSDLQKMKPYQAIVIRTRLNPYKAKLFPNHQMDWHMKKYEDEPFATRAKEAVKVFDIKEFVQNKKQSKIMGMLDNNESSSGIGPNPFMNSPMNDSASPSFNVDDLVKKIDQKIAELEAQEKAEQEDQNKEKINSEMEMVKPVLEEPDEIVPKKVTDDQFFDDFFDE